jgi:hypothetical protein
MGEHLPSIFCDTCQFVFVKLAKSCHGCDEGDILLYKRTQTIHLLYENLPELRILKY